MSRRPGSLAWGAAALVLLGWAGGARGALVDRLAAVVNDDVITWTEVYELGSEHIETAVQGAADPAGERRKAELEVLDALIERHLVEQEMARLDLDVEDADLERAVGDIARQNNLDREALRQEVERSGLAWEVYLEELGANLREMKFNQQVLGPRISVHDDEVLAWYKRNQGAFSGTPGFRIQAILLPADPSTLPEVLKRAEALRAEVLGGRSFEDVARANSAEPFASRGGDMGVVQKGQLMADLDSAVFALEVGQITQPVATSAGVFLVRLAERVVPPPPPFDEVKDRIRQQVMEEKVQEAREQWLAQARRRSMVKVLLEGGEPDVQASP